MQHQDGFKAHGAVAIVLKRADGSFESFKKDNLIVDVGFDFIADAIGKPSGRPNAMSHIAIGSGTTAAAAAQTALVTEITRLAADYAHTAGTKVLTFTANFAPGVGTGAITEAGVLNAAAAGIMFDRVVFPVVNKGVDDSLMVIFTITLA